MRINTNNNCNLVIIDDTQYPIKIYRLVPGDPPYNELQGTFNYNETASLYIVQQNFANGSSKKIYDKLVPHVNSTGELPSGEPYVINLDVDQQDGGWFTIMHFVLPKVEKACDAKRFLEIKDYISDEQIDQVLGETGDLEQRTIYVGRYFTDGTYLYTLKENGEIEKVNLEEFIELASEGNIQLVRQYGIYVEVQNFFSMCHLRKCFASLCKKVFDDTAFTRCFTKTNDSELVYRRDLVWAALNSIQYYIDSGQYAEAQRLLERLTSDCGLCKSEDTGTRGCGCK